MISNGATTTGVGSYEGGNMAQVGQPWDIIASSAMCWPELWTAGEMMHMHILTLMGGLSQSLYSWVDGLSVILTPCS